MKQLSYITVFSLIVALTGLSPVVAADAGWPSNYAPSQPDELLNDIDHPLKLSTAQMDNIRAGNARPVHRTHSGTMGL